MIIVYILIAVLLFGILIAVHEFGHFIAAKSLGVKVNEFAIGMGPKLWHKQKGETEYTWRLFPIGGFCAMEGEGEDSGDPRAFNNKARWKRLIILVAGAFMNFVVGVLIILVLVCQTNQIAYPAVGGFPEWSTLDEQGLQVGDRFLEIDGHKVYAYGDAAMLIGRAGNVADIVVLRDGETVLLKDFALTPHEVEEDGKLVLQRGVTLGAEYVEATLPLRLQTVWYQAIDYVRMVWMGLGDLVTGAVGIRDMSGVVGIVDMVGEVGEAGASNGGGFAGAFLNILNFFGFIAVNLAVMNLLPIPALDGGQILFLGVDKVYHLLTKKKINQKYLGYINAAGFICLIGLMVVVAFSDVLKLLGH